MRSIGLLVLILVFSIKVGTLAAEDTDQQTIRLGVIAPLSGDFAYQGAFIRNGVSLATQELSQQNLDIKVIYEDACLPKQTLPAAQRLVSSKINILVGSYCVIGMIPTAPLFIKNKIPAFHSSVVPNALLSKSEQSYVLTTNTSIESEARFLANFAVNKLSGKKAGIFSFPSEWGDNYQAYFSKEFIGLGGEIVEVSMSKISQIDFRAELTKMKAKKIDTLFVALISSALGIVVRQAQELGLDVNILSANEAEDQQFFQTAKKASDGVWIAVPGMDESLSSVKNFTSNYETKFGNKPSVTAANAYDATYLGVSALVKCNFDPKCTKQAIYQTHNYQGGSGQITIKPDGSSQRQFQIKQAKNGKFTRLPHQKRYH